VLSIGFHYLKASLRSKQFRHEKANNRIYSSICCRAMAVYFSSGCNSTKNPTSTAKILSGGGIKIASFNIQNFGKTKAGKPEVMQLLAEIIRKYDVIAIQEVSDKTESAPRKLLEVVNSNGSTYKLLLSERTGQQHDDRTSQEQYAYYYNSKTVKQIDQARLFDDNAADLFQREPYLARFKVLNGNFSFVLVNIHTRPEQAVEEICALEGVIDWARTIYPNEDDFIALGDFNGGCSYASSAKLDQCNFRNDNFIWVIPDEADTNLAVKQCAYDRMVGTTGMKSDYPGQWGIDNSFSDKGISDHWPIWVFVLFRAGQSLKNSNRAKLLRSFVIF
jgi:endonuclease/exonuclease/phosphatase family metal-dependent hydrolase